jgi:hypothetical protein
MKKIYNPYRLVLALGVATVLSTSLIPVTSLARNGSSGDSSTTESHTKTADTMHETAQSTASKHADAELKLTSGTGAKFCTRLNDVDSKIAGEENKRIDNYNTKRGKSDTSLAQHQTDRATKLAAARAKADAERQARFAKLEAKATTADQKAAVTAFEATVNQAVLTRRAAVDAADAAFHAAVDAATKTRRSQIDAAVSTYKSAIASAQSQAKISCAAGTDPATVRQTFATAAAAARANLKTSVQNADKVKDQLTALNATRKTAVEAAQAAFKATVAQAAITLKAAFPG